MSRHTETAHTMRKEITRPLERKVDAVNILGVELPRRTEQSEYLDARVPSADRFIHFTEDAFSLELLQKVAKGVALETPTMLEGGAATGKSYTVEYLAHLLNRPVYRMSLNGQTDTTDLIGKWVPRSESAEKRIRNLIKNPDECASSETRRLISSKQILPDDETGEIAPEQARPAVGFSKEELQNIAEWEGMEIKDADWVWQDGDLPRQIREGAWSILDEVNTCEPHFGAPQRGIGKRRRADIV